MKKSGIFQTRSLRFGALLNRVAVAGFLYCAVLPVSAVTLELTTVPPVPTSDDVYNFSGGENDDANIANGNDANTYVAGDRPTQGQTFTTGNSEGGYVLNEIWIRHAGYTVPASSGNGTWWTMGNGGRWVLRVTDPSGNGQPDFVLRSETYVSTGTEYDGAMWSGGNDSLGDDVWLKFTLSTPVALAPETEYAIDLTATGSPGLNFFEWLGNRTNVYQEGSAYTGTTAATPGNTVNLVTGDRVFLVRLGHTVPAVAPDLTSTLRYVPAGQFVSVRAVIPSVVNANDSVSLVITNNDPGVLGLPGGASTITLNFNAGATNVQEFQAEVLANGQGTLSVVPNDSFTDASILIGTPVSAAESFAYDPAVQFYLDQANGGAGFSGPWTQPTLADFVSIGLTYGSTASLVTEGSAAYVVGAGNEAFRPLEGTYGGVGGGTVWISFLIQAPSGLFDWGGVSLWNGMTSEELFMGEVVSQSPNNTWGFSRGNAYFMNFPSGTGPGPETDFLVYRIDFPETNGGRALVSFYANPALNNTAPFSPSGSAYVDNFTFDTIRLGSGDYLVFDEVRIGTRWTDVMQFTGAPEPLAPPVPTLTAPSRFAPVGGVARVTVSIPEESPRPIFMEISNANPASFSVSATNAGLVTLQFPVGGTNVQTLDVHVLGEGATVLTVLSNANVGTTSLELAAQVSASDSFEYPEGQDLLFGQMGGTGFDVNTWLGGGSVISPGLTYPGLITAGNAVTINAAGSGNATRTLSGLSGIHGGAGGGTVWISFLIQGEFPASQQFAGVSLLNGDAEMFFMGLTTGEPNNGKWGFRGAGQGQDASFPDSVEPSSNVDLLVYRLDFPASGDLVEVTFYANPPVGPAPPAVSSGSGVVHNFTFNAIRLGTDFSMNFDEVRLGGSWTEVVPGVALPALSVERVENQIRITWPASLTGFELQSSTSLNSGWGAAGLPVTTQGDQSVATDTLTGDGKFYRLRSAGP